MYVGNPGTDGGKFNSHFPTGFPGQEKTADLLTNYMKMNTHMPPPRYYLWFILHRSIHNMAGIFTLPQPGK